MLDLMERSSGTSNSDEIEERLKTAEIEVERMREEMKQIGQEHEEEVKQLKYEQALNEKFIRLFLGCRTRNWSMRTTS